jgi:hypothetical protein
MSADRKPTIILVLEEILEKAANHPIEAANAMKKTLKVAEKGHYHAIYVGLAAALALHKTFGDDDKWQEFHDRALKDANFARKPRNDDRLMSIVLYLFDGTSAHRYNRCVKYAGALRELEAEGVEPEDVPQALKDRGGIDRIYEGKTPSGKGSSAAPSAASGKSGKGRGSASGNQGQNQRGSDDDEWGNEDDNGEQSDDERRIRGLIAVAHDRRRSWLLLEARKRWVNLALGSHRGELFTLIVKNAGKTSVGGVRFLLRTFKREA